MIVGCELKEMMILHASDFMIIKSEFVTISICILRMIQGQIFYRGVLERFLEEQLGMKISK